MYLDQRKRVQNVEQKKLTKGKFLNAMAQVFLKSRYQPEDDTVCVRAGDPDVPARTQYNQEPAGSLPNYQVSVYPPP